MKTRYGFSAAGDTEESQYIIYEVGSKSDPNVPDYDSGDCREGGLVSISEWANFTGDAGERIVAALTLVSDLTTEEIVEASIVKGKV